MELLIIIALILLGLFLMVAEILLLPGITVAAFASLLSFLASLYFAYIGFGIGGFFITFMLSLVLIVGMLFICTKRKNLKKISLETKIDSKSSVSASEYVKIGDTGYSKTRLAPMGMVVVGDHIIEAKSFDGYISQNEKIEIVAMEDSVVIVKKN